MSGERMKTEWDPGPHPARVSTVGDWGSSFDSIAGVVIEDGEELDVAWPNGITERVMAHVRSRHGEVQDHGHVNSTTVTRAFVERDYNGVAILVPLRGLVATRIAQDPEPAIRGRWPLTRFRLVTEVDSLHNPGDEDRSER